MSVYENFSKPIKAAINRKANRLAQELIPRLRIALAQKLVQEGLVAAQFSAEWRADELLVGVNPDLALEGVRELEVRALSEELAKRSEELCRLRRLCDVSGIEP